MHEKIIKNPLDATTAEAPETIGSQPWGIEPYSTKRDGASITDCDAEPVRTPGCIQAHGALLVLRMSDLSILQASENTQAILGQAASELLGQSVAVVVTQGVRLNCAASWLPIRLSETRLTFSRCPTARTSLRWM